jgi:hypothetical protein
MARDIAAASVRSVMANVMRKLAASGYEYRKNAEE